MKIYGFIHIYTVNNWQEIIEEQFLKMNKSGLLDKTERIFVGINGGDGQWINSLDDKVKVLYQFHKPELEQSLTLSWLRFFAAVERDAKIFYIHTKGVTHINSIPQTDWRHMMEYFVLTKYEVCLQELEKSDIVGTNWHLGRGYMGAHSKKAGGIEVTPHFSGNFWWSNTKYLRTLPPLFPLISKYSCEFWIGKGRPKVSELWHSGIHHHRNPYPESNYMGVNFDCNYYR